jgi:hypothetical protein
MAPYFTGLGTEAQMQQVHPKYGYTLLTPEQRAEILTHLGNGLSCREITERMGLKYVQQVAGVMAARTRALRAVVNGSDEDDEPGEIVEPVDVATRVDTSDVLRIGTGCGVVYAYRYDGLDKRLKIGRADGSAEQRIADQISTGSPGKPMLVLEIKTDDCRKLERALHAVLDLRGLRIVGGGNEWFAVTREEVVALHATLGGKIQPNEQLRAA